MTTERKELILLDPTDDTQRLTGFVTTISTERTSQPPDQKVVMGSRLDETQVGSPTVQIDNH